MVTAQVGCHCRRVLASGIKGSSLLRECGGVMSGWC